MLSIIQGAADELQQLLEDRSHRSESKAWLIRTLSQLQHISPSARWACFHPCWPGSSSAASSSRSAHARSTHGNAQQQRAERSALATCRDAELHLLQLLAEQAPADVSALLLRDPDWLCDFLTASRDRIKSWFGHFGPTGIHQFKFGARALANYALAERAEVWRHLVWAGKHSQSPVAVAVKPHYFGELDVVPTVQNLARACPGFWASDELMRSCQAGDWLALDRQAVSQELLRLLHDQRSSRHTPLLQLLTDFLATADWALLCHQLLPLLPDRGLLQVAHALAHHASIPQRQQQKQLSLQQQQQQQQRQQQGQGRGRGSSIAEGLLQAWCCGKQAGRDAQVAAAAAAAGGTAEARLQGGPGRAELQAAAVAAARLPCVTDTHLLLLGCLQCADTGSSAWTLKELLMANALTCSRYQLLLLRQDDDSDSRLPALVSAAAALCAPGGTAGPAAAAAPSAGSSIGLAEAAAAVQHLPRSQQLLLLLTAAWLLRLHLLLQLSGAAVTAREANAEQQQQQQQFVEVQLPTGGECRLAIGSSTSHSSNPTLGHQQEQRQQTTQQQHVSATLHGQPAKVPLRRGLTTTGTATAAARDGSDSDSSKGAKHRRKHKHNKKSSKSTKKARHKRRSRSDSDSEAAASDSSSSRSDGSSGGRRWRHKRGRKRRRCDDSSSEPLSNDDAWAALDLDAGGELLEPTALPAMPHNTLKPAHTTPQPHTGTAADSTPAAPVPAASGGSSPAACCHAAAGAAAAVQQQALAVLSLREVQGRLASLSAGGDLWQWPLCVADVSVVYTRQCDTKLASSGLVTVSGSIAEVADAVAYLWLCGTLARLCGG